MLQHLWGSYIEGASSACLYRIAMASPDEAELHQKEEEVAATIVVNIMHVFVCKLNST